MSRSKKWQLEMRQVSGSWQFNSSHVSCDSAKTRARNITGYYGNPQWRIMAPNGNPYVTGQKQNGKMKWRLGGVEGHADSEVRLR